MSLAFGTLAGGSADTDTATISYTGRPTAVAIGCWIKKYDLTNGYVLQSPNTPGNLYMSIHQDFTAWAPRIYRAYSTTALEAYAGGRIPGSGWTFWMVAHSGVATDAAIFEHESGSNADFVPSQTNGAGTLDTTTGSLIMGYALSGVQTPLRARIGELFILDYVPTSTERAALASGGSPMDLAVKPVWYNRLRNSGIGSDLQVGTMGAVSGAAYVNTDNPTVADPSSGTATRRLLTMGVG